MNPVDTKKKTPLTSSTIDTKKRDDAEILTKNHKSALQRDINSKDAPVNDFVRAKRKFDNFDVSDSNSQKKVKIMSPIEEPKLATGPLISSLDFQQRSSENHDRGQPFILIFHNNEYIHASDLIYKIEMSEVQHRVYKQAEITINESPIYVMSPKNTKFFRIGNYAEITKSIADGEFFDDIVGGASGHLETPVKPWIQAVASACASVAYRFGWLLPKDELSALRAMEGIEDNLKPYAFSFALQHAVRKQRPDIVQYCLAQDADPLCGHRAERDLYTGCALEIACETQNTAILNMLMQRLTKKEDTVRLVDLFCPENGWEAIPKAITDHMKNQG